MNDYPGKPEDSFEPNAFDADAFLTDTLSKSDRFEAELKSFEAEQIAGENTVMDALEEVGFPISPVRSSQVRFAPDAPLTATIEKLVPMRERFRAAGRLEDAAIAHTVIVLSLAIGEVAALKQSSDNVSSEGQSLYKQQQQANIYANDQLQPEHKEFFLAAVDKLYPGVKGLEPDSPDTAVTIQEYDEDQNYRAEIREKAAALRELADTALRNAMAEVGLGQHDQLESVASTIVVVLTRMHVVETGDYSDEQRQATEFASRTSLNGGVRKKAMDMGWSEAQTEAVLDYVRASLREAESEK